MTLYHYQGLENLLSIENDISQQEERVSSFLRKSIQTNNLSVFIGSGCSYPTVPLMGETMGNLIASNEDIKKLVSEYLTIKDLIEFINKKIEVVKVDNGKAYEIDLYNQILEYLESINQQDNLKYYMNHIKTDDIGAIVLETEIECMIQELILSFKNIENFLTWIQNGIKFSRSRYEIQCLERTFNDIKNEFVSSIPLINTTVYKESNTLDNYNSFYNEIFKYRTEESKKLSIFTTNYDLFNEYALEYNDISYTTGFSSNLKNKFDVNEFKYRNVDDTNRYKNKWQPVNKEANLYKIHGSVNWIQNNKGDLEQDYSEDLEKDKIIIYPTVLKHRETAQTPYSELFREFANTLQKPNTTFIIIGYGFGDDHINNIISQNLTNSDFTLIILGNITESNINEFYSEYKDNLNLHIIGGKLSERTEGHHFQYIIKNLLCGKEDGDYDE